MPDEHSCQAKQGSSPAEMAVIGLPARGPLTSCEASAGSMDLQVNTTPSVVTAEECAAPAAIKCATGLEISLWPLWKTISQPLARPVAAEQVRTTSLQPALEEIDQCEVDQVVIIPIRDVSIASLACFYTCQAWGVLPARTTLLGVTTLWPQV